MKSNDRLFQHSKHNYPNNTQTRTLSEISQKPFALGLEKHLISSEDFFYNQEFFYAVEQGGSVSAYPLNDIAELRGTTSHINNSRIWQVTVSKGSKIIEYRFAHNFSLCNKNFLKFYKKVKQIRPQAIKSQWSIWRM